jgi:hypothetical protein
MSFNNAILLDPTSWQHIDANRLPTEKNIERFHDMRSSAANDIKDYIIDPTLFTDCPSVLKSACQIGELSTYTTGLKIGAMAIYSEASIVAPVPNATSFRRISPEDVVTNATWIGVLVKRVSQPNNLPPVTAWYGTKQERMIEVINNNSRQLSARKERISAIGVIGPEIIFGTWARISKKGTPLLYMRRLDQVVQRR